MNGQGMQIETQGKMIDNIQEKNEQNFQLTNKQILQLQDTINQNYLEFSKNM